MQPRDGVRSGTRPIRRPPARRGIYQVGTASGSALPARPFRRRHGGEVRCTCRLWAFGPVLLPAPALFPISSTAGGRAVRRVQVRSLSRQGGIPDFQEQHQALFSIQHRYSSSTKDQLVPLYFSICRLISSVYIEISFPTDHCLNRRIACLGFGSSGG
jgi:hypothetical protein